ncbi:MAG: hypothetical protein ACK4TI_01260 [Nitrososphaerales archaeon]
MPERIIKRARNFAPNLYFQIPMRTVVKHNIQRGDTLYCALRRIFDSEGNLLMEVNRELECQIKQRDSRFYVHPELIKELNLIGVEYYEFILYKIKKNDGTEVEIYPKEIVEKEVIRVKDVPRQQL